MIFKGKLKMIMGFGMFLKLVKFVAVGAIIYSVFYVQSIYLSRFLLLFEIAMYFFTFVAYCIVLTLKPIHRDPNQTAYQKVWFYLDFSVGTIAFVGLGNKSLGCLFFLECFLYILYDLKIKEINGLLDE